MSGPEQIWDGVDVVHDGVLDITLPASTFGVVDEVLKECARQDSKWGEQNHMPAEWLAILAEEFGEAAKETVGITFAFPWSLNYRVELIQTAAVAIRIVESYDRRVAAQNEFDRTANEILPRAQNKGQIDDPDDYLLALFEQQRKAGG